MEPTSAQSNSAVLYITDCANISDDKLFLIPRAVIHKYGYQVITASGLRDSISVLKDIRKNIILVIVNANNEEMTKLLAQVLKVHSVQTGLPIYFLTSSFSMQLHDFLGKFGFFNLISFSSSSPAELVTAIDKMVRNLGSIQKKASQQRQIVNDVRKLKSLPPLPDVYLKVETLARDNDATAADFSEILEYDSAITARLLRMANSAYFGFKREIRSVKDAITLMGTKEIVSLVRIACITNNLKVSPQVENNVKDVWIHSAICAITAQLISTKRGLSQPNKAIKEDLFIGGILHDIGKIILWKFFSDIYAPVAFNCAYKMHPTEQEEMKILGCTHAEVGATLAEHWQLPGHISNVIGFHHKPLAKDNSELVYFIHMANLVSKIVQRDFQLDHISELEAPHSDLYTTDEIVSLARDLESDIKDQSEHVINMIFN